MPASRTRKVMSWARKPVSWTDGENAYISAVFTWQLPKVYEMAIGYQNFGHQVSVGGPALHVATSYKKLLEEFCTVGGDRPDTVYRHNRFATFASRGCPVGCWFCIVPSMEGRTFTLIDDFVPRPILCDNNLSALPAEFQQHIVRRYIAAGLPLEDANSGFEPRTFDLEVFERWKQINRGPWRFALDDAGDLPHVLRVLDMLKGRVRSPNKKRVYVLIGNEPYDACMDRINIVLDRGAQPHVQPLIKLNALEKVPWVRHDWTRTKLMDVTRWANRFLYKYCEFDEYSRSTRKHHKSQAQLALTGG